MRFSFLLILRTKIWGAVVQLPTLYDNTVLEAGSLEIFSELDPRLTVYSARLAENRIRGGNTKTKGRIW